ncbi:unnamed protein product, partial [Rotaria sp. Silwood1]
AHCAPSFAKSGIYPYDPRIIRKGKLINNEANTSATATNTSCLPRSLSIEFDYPSETQYSTPNTTTTIQRKTLVKCPSAPTLNSANGTLNPSFDNRLFTHHQTNFSQQMTTTFDNTQAAISRLNDVIQETERIAMQSSSFNQSSIAFMNSSDVPSISSSIEPVTVSSLSSSIEKCTIIFLNLNEHYLYFF